MSAEKNKTTALMRYTGLATQWLVMLGLAVWGGMKLDELMGFRALAVVILPVVALVFSIWQLIRTLNKNDL